MGNTARRTGISDPTIKSIPLKNAKRSSEAPITTPVCIQLTASSYVHRRVAFLPGVPVTLTAPKPLPFPAAPKTLGEHLRKRRIELGLLQRHVAKSVGVAVNTLMTWERDRAEPEPRYWSKIISFLGYDPNPAPETLGEHLQARYRALGLPRKEVAARLQMDEGTLKKYETGASRPTSNRTRRVIKQFLRPRDVRL